MSHTGRRRLTHPKPQSPEPSLKEADSDRIFLVAESSGPEGRVCIYREADPAPSLIVSLPADSTAPWEDIPPIVASRVTALDVIEHVLDEEAWLAAAATMLAPGGQLVVRAPLEGPIAWLDSLNMYRYVQDTIGVGEDLEETKLKGWHRHYRVDDLYTMLNAANFDVVSVRRSGSPALDAAQFGALVWGGIVKRDPNIEQRVRSWRDRIEAGRDLPTLGPLSTKVTVTATRREHRGPD